MSNPFLPAAAYRSLPRPEYTWLIDGLLPVGGSLLLYGDPKVGKSFIALQAASALARGTHWLGFGVPQAVKVAYCQLDTPRSLWLDRLDRTDTTTPYPDSIYFSDLEALNVWPFDIFRAEHADALSKALAQISPDVFILDTVRESHSGDENDATIMQALMARITSVARPAACILVSHARKPGDEGASTINSNRGSNAVTGRVDGVVMLQHNCMRVEGRALNLESKKILLERSKDGTWTLTDKERIKVIARSLLEDATFASMRSRARTLGQIASLTDDAALHILRRLTGYEEGVQKSVSITQPVANQDTPLCGPTENEVKIPEW